MAVSFKCKKYAAMELGNSEETFPKRQMLRNKDENRNDQLLLSAVGAMRSDGNRGIRRGAGCPLCSLKESLSVVRAWRLTETGG